MRRRLFCVGTTAAAVFHPGYAAAALGPGTADTINIGQSIALSGPIAVQARTINSGAQLVFDATNRAGGVQGRRIHFISLDDQLQPAKTVENCERLIGERGVVAMFGLLGSGNLMAVDPLLRKSSTPVVGGLAVSDSVRTRTSGAAYYIRAGYGREAERIVDQLVTVGVPRIGIAHFANAGGEEVKKVLVDALSARNLSPVAVEAVKLDGSNVGEVVARIADARPQAVILFIGGSLPAKLIAALEGRSSFPSYYGMSVVPGEGTAKELGNRLRSLVISQVVPYPWAQNNAATVDFNKMATAAGVAINHASYEGYIGALVLVEALNRSARARWVGGLHAAMKSMKTRVGGMEVDFTKGSNTGSHFVELVHVTGSGRFVR